MIANDLTARGESAVARHADVRDPLSATDTMTKQNDHSDAPLDATAAPTLASRVGMLADEMAARLPRETLERLQFDRLDAILSLALPGNDAAHHNAFLRRRLGLDEWKPGSLRTLVDLRELPFTTRADLTADQAEFPPYGTNLSRPLDRYIRFFQTSGTSSGAPLRWLYDAEAWEHVLHCWRIVFGAAGVTGRGDRVFFPFSFGPFLGFWAAFDGASRLGALCLPGGGMSTTARLQFLRDNGATVVCCTPTYAQRLADVAEVEGINLSESSVRALIVAGEPGGSMPGVVERLERAWGAHVLDHTGMTEIGSLGFEFVDEPGSVYLIETECIPEVIDPTTGTVLDENAAREVGGELVLTSLSNAAMPLVRYRTGDFVQLDRRGGANGRTFARMIGGIRGRIDDMLLIKGNNVYPSAIEEVVRSIGGVEEFQIDVWQHAAGSRVKLTIEPSPEVASAESLAARLKLALRDRLQFTAEIEVTAPGSLPRFELKARRLTVHRES